MWDSAAFSGIFLASGFSCSQAESTPAHTQVTQTVGWEVFVYRYNEPTEGNLIARWKSSSVGVDWIDLLVEEGKARDLGGSGYPCIYMAAASAFLPVIASGFLKREFPPSSLARSAIFPNDFSGIVWNKQNLLKCEPGEDLLIYLYDQS